MDPPTSLISVKSMGYVILRNLPFLAIDSNTSTDAYMALRATGISLLYF